MDFQRSWVNMWQNIRLELAATPDFPGGSASRAYMLHLPLREDGTIDDSAVATNPKLARFRRFWPSETDRSGQIIRNEGGWSLALAEGDGRQIAFPIEMDRLKPSDEVTIAEYGGERRQFRVVDLRRV